MQINRKNGLDANTLGQVKPGAAERGSSKAVRRDETAAGAADRAKRDSVSFSDEARALASGSSTREAASSERVEDVRQRVMLGAYNTAEMAGEVARRILQCGDL